MSSRVASGQVGATTIWKEEREEQIESGLDNRVKWENEEEKEKSRSRPFLIKNEISPPKYRVPSGGRNEPSVRPSFLSIPLENISQIR